MTDPLFDLSGKVAVVTGGSRGIGEMIARAFVSRGVCTYITARKEAELAATHAALGALGECVALPADLSTVAGAQAFAAAVAEREPGVDILINNAGATWGAPLDAFPESGWDKVMDVNVKGLFFLTQALLPRLLARATADDPARVVNISSINGLTNPKMPNYSYAASKAAVVQLTRHLAADLAPRHVNVNGIAPGFFPSKMTAFALTGGEEPLARMIPRGRIGRPDDAAGAAVFLCARASAWITGHTLVVDGGMVAAAG